jgi:hypothetical protein
MLFIIFGPSKTGTTSVYKLLLENKMFPILYTHDMKKISVTDNKFNTLEWKLSNIGKKKRYNDISPGIIEYCIEIYKSEPLIRLLKEYDIKLIQTLRDPLLRRISQIFHTLSYQNILEKSGTHNIYNINSDNIDCKILKYAIKYIQEHKELLHIGQLEYIIDNFFNQNTPYEYIDYFNTFDSFFKDNNNILIFTIHLSNIDEQALMKFLGLSITKTLNKERDMLDLQYIVEGHILYLKDYVMNYMKNKDTIKQMLLHPIVKKISY